MLTIYFNWASFGRSMEDKDDYVYTVSQLTGLIKTMLQESFPCVHLKGEISNFKANSTGHLYFSLKDAGAQINAVMFRGSASRLAFTPKDGMLVQARGRISVYEAQGRYQIIIDSMTQAGLGDIMEMLEARKRKLAAEGLFAEERKKPLPPYPATIGVVTSPTGAALRDILNIARRRNDKVNVVVLPAQVQGEGAAETIVRMIRTADQYRLCDILIVGRGGGSLEDLLPFSDESVVRAIAACSIPTISAVGHEIDWALSDFAADKRAPTPSAAAELAVPEKRLIEDAIRENRESIHESLAARLRTERLKLKGFSRDSLELQFRMIEQPYLQRLDSCKSSLTDEIGKLVEGNRTKLALLSQTLSFCSPQTIFDRGYSMVTDAESGLVIRDAGAVPAGTELIVRPSKGSLTAKVL